MIENSLRVFSTRRAIRDFQSQFDDAFVPQTATISEFFDNATLVRNLSQASQIDKIILMQNAVKETILAQNVLKFNANFYEFLKNKDYIFSFFKELAIEQKSIDELKNSDYYSAYDEHLAILGDLLANYKAGLKSHGLYDEISFGQNYELNENYILRFDEIIIEIDGIISKQECEILAKISELTSLKVRFWISKFNEKLAKLLSEISQISLPKSSENDKKFELNFATKEIKEIPNDYAINNVILHRELSSDSLECAYIYEKISTFIRDGIAPQKICVILPDENKAKLLKLYDKTNLLNFAMGKPTNETKFFQILSKIVSVIKENENPKFIDNYLEKAEFYTKNELFLYLNQVTNELYDFAVSNFYESVEFAKFSDFIEQISALSDENLSQIISETLKEIEIFSDSYDLKFGEICEIFMLLVKDKKISDVSGGKVSVIGLLESRGVKFDAVIIPDFNDDVIPKREISEMFLNSAVREKAGLISYIERENLQRFYYKNAIFKAKKVAICYLGGETKTPSRFLKNFNTIEDKTYSDDEYLGVLGCKNAIKTADFGTPYIATHDFFAEALSFSRLNTFIKCPRKYAYNYIEKIAQPRAFDTSPSAMGNAFHESMKEFYSKFAKFDSEKFIEIFTQKAKIFGVNELDTLVFVKKIKLEVAKILENHEQIWTFEDGEKEFKEVEFNGIKLKGYIDRIDTNGTQKCVIDYKTGSVDTKSLQLALYQGLLGVECEAKFLSVKEAKFETSKQNLDDLKAQIDEIKMSVGENYEFERKNDCVYCPYISICKGEI